MKATHRTTLCIIIAFLLSLLFHLSSVIYVAWQKPYQNNLESPQDKEETLKEKIAQQKEWAETKARASNFGAPVMFQDEISYEENETTEDEKPQEKPIEEIVEKENPIIPKATAIKPITQPTTLPPQEISKPTLQTKKALKPITTPNKQITAPKPPLSLAQLTQGFLSHIKEEGTHAIHMLGNKKGAATEEQIKYERYLQKINWCLQNSFNINREKFPVSAMVKNNVHIFLALNKDGSIRQCTITKTSGNLYLDEFVMFNFKDAGGAFPPVPNYLPDNPFAVTFIVLTDPADQSYFKMYRQ